MKRVELTHTIAVVETRFEATTAQIRDLLAAATAEGNDSLRVFCVRALVGDNAARAACTTAIRERARIAASKADATAFAAAFNARKRGGR